MLLFDVFYTLLGLIIGSFLNVCIYRIPRRESIVHPGSRCPNCSQPVRPYDNIPVLSYLLLLGRCRFCKNPISIQYPLVELLAGLSFYACAWKWAYQPPTFVNSLFLCLIIVLIFVDYEHQLLPNVITLPGILLGFGLCRLQDQRFFMDALSYTLASALMPDSPETCWPWMGSITGAFIGGGFLLVVGFGYQLVRKRQGMGVGDVKMLGMVGAFLGWRLAFLTIFAGSMIATIVGILLILFRGQTLQSRLPFGTFLGGGAILSLFVGLSFLQWYAPPPQP
jgi:leader peptidase (prepilin peptidase)/N-methyltransferase